jgi:hypothetical protein
MALESTAQQQIQLLMLQNLDKPQSLQAYTKQHAAMIVALNVVVTAAKNVPRWRRLLVALAHARTARSAP